MICHSTLHSMPFPLPYKRSYHLIEDAQKRLQHKFGIENWDY
uniref:Uncharacterized protein n=1 Tax=Arundo donax TaxID=35708 RepID=A0A0A9FL71_ARUDO